MNKIDAVFFGSIVGTTFIICVIAAIILLIYMKVFDYFHETKTFMLYVNTDGRYLPYVSTTVGKVCEKYNSTVLITELVKAPTSNQHLGYMKFTIMCYTRHMKYIKNDLSRCMLQTVSRLEYSIE